MKNQIERILEFRFLAPYPKFQFFVSEFFYFGIKQAWACLFGGLLLAGILVTHFFWPDHFILKRYDFLFIYALAIQAVFLFLKLETWEEVKVIFVFHVVGTCMEIFKTSAGSWMYPEENLIRIAGVPLFSGFMYSAVGSYIARVWRIFEFKFSNYPKHYLTVILCVLIYINFFSHHYFTDIRYLLFAFTAVLYWKTWVFYKPNNTYFKMPLLLGWFLVSFFIWIAENFGTFGQIWSYPTQLESWHFVSPQKMGSWYLLMIISFVLVTVVHKDREG